ncbi:putative aldouronate transport system permease protein [Halolactibacillus halophilus]|uniref:Putative aldouronate transport system permease protein n=1 Tax=Halolactibacillus halophilus TaxID=306540 RepID=A0A1I5RH83_9BACI|nr:carbohydrate ABC transporter permease [Halolactibacillus halophilus]GEM02357.1 sugar ABC transporter permease [Halolactibacillus halophilus]SFP57929.1 putative aldouronate transport system permease protein [Halolactibacillus halophilus]
MERLNRSEKIFKVLSYLLVGAFGIIALYPVVYAFSASISGKIAYETGQIVLFPKDINFEVYSLLYEDKGFWLSYINTLFYTFFGTAWSMFISITGAYALAKKKLLFRRHFNFLVVFTMWFVAGMIPQYLNYTSMGVANRWGIVVAFGIQAYNIILLRNTFEGIPTEIEEAAIVDGVKEFQLLSRIYIPMSKAGIATVTLFYATTRWNGYFWSRILLTDPKELPVQVYMRILIENYQAMFDDMPVNLSYASDSYVYAILVCSIVPVLLIYPQIQKYFAKGANLGGVKG